MNVLRMIDTVNANDNVGEVVITVSSDNELNDEVLKMMMNKYSNVYSIYVHDKNNHVDNGMHKIIKQWV